MLFDHINISAPMPLLNQERDFFCALFDLDVGFRPRFKSIGYWLYNNQKQAVIHLTMSESHQLTRLGCLDHIAFQSKGLLQFMSRLDNLKVDFSSDYLPELEMTQLFFRTPSHIGIEVNFIGEQVSKFA